MRHVKPTAGFEPATFGPGGATQPLHQKPGIPENQYNQGFQIPSIGYPNKEHNILAATRPIMFYDALAISLAVPAISWANWPMAFFEHFQSISYVSFSRPENQNPARRHHLAQIAKSPILRFDYG